MLCVPIKGPTIAQAQQQLAEAQQVAHLVEWRLDLFDTLDLAQLMQLKTRCSIPIIFTLRPKSQGGGYKFTEEQRLLDLKRLAELNPDFMDVEYTVSAEVIQKLKEQHPAIKIILSYHDFEKTPASLEAITAQMLKTLADYYKIAVLAQSMLDTFTVVLFAKKSPENRLLMTMGETGPLSRILAPIVQRPFTYASLAPELATAPGQISARELIDIYHYPSLTTETQIYGLIGNPIDKSISQYTHNAVMHQLNLKSVYIKMLVEPQELPQFLQQVQELGVRGLSVTMPLKEKIIPFLDSVDTEAQAIGAVNTVVCQGNKRIGYNTDGKGALDAIEKHGSVQRKKIVLLGAGGAIKAVAWEALRRKAEVVILNRDAEKARVLAAKLGCLGGGLDQIAQHTYDIIINGTPHDMPIDPRFILPNTLAMDLTSIPKDTPFLIEAKRCGCTPIYGYEMFIQQAIAQFKLWFPEIDAQQVENILNSANPL